MNVSAYFYNHNLKTRGGKMAGVITTEQVPVRLARAVVAGIERGIAREIMRYPWQSETCIGNWHYDRALFNQPGEYGRYQSPKDVIHWLIDTVSKNGTFILNIPGRPDGTIDSKEAAVLDKITEWMAVNGEAIYATRPWKVYGEGPATKGQQSGSQTVSQPGAEDIRFTRNKAGTVVYAIVLGLPGKDVVVKALGTSSPQSPVRIATVELLGCQDKIRLRQGGSALRVQLPAQMPCDYAIARKVSLA